MAVANATCSIKWYGGKKQQVLQVSDKILYDIARRTLDMTYQTIPLANYVGSGKLRTSSMGGSVKGEKLNYYIGSYTSYAKYVWNMGDSTNWSTAGTNGQWYAKTWQKQAHTIVANAIERNKLK
jgi:hypothetical protein